MKPKNAFENVSVRKSVLINAVPAIVSMLVTLIYNVADTFFIGQTGNEMQVAAVSLATPVFLLFMAFGILYGIGGTSVISRALGENKEDLARSASAFCFWASGITGIICILCVIVGMEPILGWIGAGQNTEVYARTYLSYIAWSAPFVIISTAFSNIVRAEGKSKEAMNGLLLGTILNIILDPLFILTFEFGIAGAAWASVIGNIIATLYYIRLLLRGDSHLSIAIQDFQRKWETIKSVFAIGIPASLNSILMNISNIILNISLVAYGDITVAAMGIALKINMIVVSLQVGLGQGIQPLLGYNYGAREWKRFKEILCFSKRMGLVMGIVLTVICWYASDTLVHLFIDSPGIQEYGTRFVRMLLISGPVIGILFIYINALQAVGAARYSLILSVSRQGIVFIPCLILFDYLFQLKGIVIAQPIADILSCLLAIGLFLRTEKHIINNILTT